MIAGPKLIAALKWGAIVGVAVYLFEILLALAENALTAHTTPDVTAHPIQLIPICLVFFGLLFAFSAAGFYTARETGHANLGALAGAVTLAVQYLLGLLYSPSRPTTPAATPQANLNPGLTILAQVVAPLLFVGVAASLGWLGGRPGAQRYAQPAPPIDSVTAAPSLDLPSPPGTIQPGS
jgi:hypothetical protein